MVTFVSTRVGFGGEYASPTPIVPSSYSHLEPVIGSSGTSSRRYWEYTATEDGAVRLDIALSKPEGPAKDVSYCLLHAYRRNPGGGEEGLDFFLDSGGASQVGTYNLTGASLMVEAGETYLFQVWNPFAPYRWGLVLRMSALRPAEETWYQMPDRVVNSIGDEGDTGGDWNNTTATNAWDRIEGRYTNGSGLAFHGNWTWHRSFHGLDPITEIGAYLAITHPWQQTCSQARGTFPFFYAAPAFNGTLIGVPPEAPYLAPHFGGGGTVGAWSRWSADASGLPPFEYASSDFEMQMGAKFLSLNRSRWMTGPTVYYTIYEMMDYAGADPAEVVGLLYEDVLPDVMKVEVVPDWSGEIPGGSWTDAPAQWWVGVSRFDPSIYYDSFTGPPAPTGTGWGPIAHRIDHPSGDFIDTPLWVLGDTVSGKWPRAYLDENDMTHLGNYLSSMHSQAPEAMTVWEVPEGVWQAALAQEEAMLDWTTYLDDDVPYPEQLEYLNLEGLTFMVGIAEALAPIPTSPGVPTPSIEAGTAHSKGLEDLVLWPRITYRPTRFKIVYAPEQEIPLLVPTGALGPLRQHFEPIPPT